MKTTSPSSRRQRTGFTLVELLVVIAIIGILAAMSLAVIPRVVNSAKRTKARLEAQDIATAIQHYDSTYGRFPVSTPAQNAAAIGTGDFTYGNVFLTPAATLNLLNATYAMSNSEVIAILMNLTNYPGGGWTSNTNFQKNPQKVIFLSAKMSGWDASQGLPAFPGVDKDLVYRDPWGNPYVITMDLNFDEQSADSFYAMDAVSSGGLNGLIKTIVAGNPVWVSHTKVMVWSAGPDKKIDPTIPANSGVNKDNVISW